MDGASQAIHPFQPDFNLPPISNPPQQFFGGQSQDQSPLLPDFSFGDDFDDLQFDDGGQAGGHEGKRRRIAKACDMCRKKKIKCDGGTPSCKNCINYKTECVFTHVEKKRNPPKGAKYIEGLENRLARMEGLLRKSGLLDGDDGEENDLRLLEKKFNSKSDSAQDDTPGRSSKSGSQQPPSTSPHSPTQNDEAFSPTTSAKSAEHNKETCQRVEELSDMMCTLVTNNHGDARYVGSSSGFSIFSPKGIQWVNEKTGDTSFQDMITQASVHDINGSYWKPEIFSDLFARREFQPLPPQDEAHSLLRDFFENFNCMFPLFHEPTFMHLVDRQYSSSPYDGSGWWASFNCALAIAHRLRVMSNLVPQEEDRKGWGYLKNAMGVLTELTMRNTDLLSVQALIGMALFLLGTPNPQPSFFLVAAAARLANSIGLHKRGSGFNLNAVETEQRSRVFWIAYCLDKDICLRSGRPPAQDDDDMNVDLPAEDPPDNIGNIPLPDGKGKANLFRLMVEFAIIESKVYKQLYSTKASKQSDGVLLNTIGELDKELEEWKDRIPLDLRPEHEIKATHPPLVLHVAVLHFAYYNCLTTIHRMSVHHGFWTNRLSSYALQGLNARAVNPRVFSSAALCVTAARASIQLIRYIPQGDYSCVWLILYYPVSALVTLFANILQNPQDTRARSDVKLMNQVVSFLSMLSVTEEQGGVKRMLGVCAEFERIAKCVLDKPEKGGRQKRKTDMANSTTTNGHGGRLTSPRSTGPSTSNTTPSAPTLGQSLTPEMANHTFKEISPNGNATPAASSQEQVDRQLSSTLPSFSETQPDAFPDLSTLVNQPSMNPEAGGPLDASHHSIPDMSHFPTDNPTSPLNMGAFQQPFVPQDLWNMNMTMEWDWADLNITTSGIDGGNDGGGEGGGVIGGHSAAPLNGSAVQDQSESLACTSAETCQSGECVAGQLL